MYWIKAVLIHCIIKWFRIVDALIAYQEAVLFLCRLGTSSAPNQHLSTVLLKISKDVQILSSKKTVPCTL